MSTASPTLNATHWFEIAVADLDRATRFYETTLGISLKRETFFGTPMGVFPADETGVGGALVVDARLTPGGPSGSLVYLNAEGKLDAALSRVAGAGGEVVKPKTGIGENGFIALVRDSEKNLIGLHSFH
jgi:uncharacterized protein